MSLVNRQARRIDWNDVKSRLQRSKAVVENVLVEDDPHVREILDQRSRQLASRGQTRVRGETGLRTLVVALGAERYGLELGALVEVLPFGKFTPVPGASPTLVGVINRRGQIRSVVSLYRLLELSGPESERGSGYIIMLRGADVEIGVRVDQVERITSVSLNSLAALSEEGDSVRSGYIRGVSPEGVIVLNISAILAHPFFKGDSDGNANSTLAESR